MRENFAMHLGNYGIEEHIPHVHGIGDHQVLTTDSLQATCTVRLWKAPGSLLRRLLWIRWLVPEGGARHGTRRPHLEQGLMQRFVNAGH
jgi:hypothetical protein